MKIWRKLLISILNLRRKLLRIWISFKRIPNKNIFLLIQIIVFVISFWVFLFCFFHFIFFIWKEIFCRNLLPKTLLMIVLIERVTIANLLKTYKMSRICSVFLKKLLDRIYLLMILLTILVQQTIQLIMH